MSPPDRVPGTRRQRVLYVLPSIDDELSEAVKNALAVRNACAVDGRCPDCGAVGEVSQDANHPVFHFTFRHEDGCSALLEAGS